ncbi:hypothetical protein Q764_00180 [Flavobacterium suncheonense GH29-5 = DSM 17707]|uniref:Uncharacterized protein n=1 Tax=Flavobacterium suncheonense GH29-5 = DSM 17707 TaxID=1121899 RepID=A0A0A2MQP0_9FLAO|nr:hypothetical protein Q764_00180 [Flavobacterium suncheonense GH29-5 = DSM 17707]
MTERNTKDIFRRKRPLQTDTFIKYFSGSKKQQLLNSIDKAWIKYENNTQKNLYLPERCTNHNRKKLPSVSKAIAKD